MSYKNIIGLTHTIETLKTRRVLDFNIQVENLREIMKLIGKNSITLNTSEAIGPGHTFGLDKKYSLTVNLERVTFLNNSNTTVVIDDVYLQNCKWFQVYIYIVEMEFELKKFNNHIMDSIAVSRDILKE